MIETIQYQGLKWHHISNPNEEDYRFLLETYNFHPLDIEDCRGTNQRPKIDEYDDYYFLILHFPYFDKGNKFIRIKEVKIFWGKDYIITIEYSDDTPDGSKLEHDITPNLKCCAARISYH